jgi:hypothetical protein
MDSIPIVAIGFNRPDSLARLLKSLLKANYPESVKLYISIDGGGGKETVTLAEHFQWPHGEKEVILREEHLGLKKHIMKCASMVENHRAIILLEDDLYVSPGFYTYTLDAVDYYGKHPLIGGISLYSHGWNETAQFPFQPLVDESDVFFIQYASSWGQCWTREQWTGFSQWLKQNDSAYRDAKHRLPPNVVQWSDASWKKIFILYLIISGKYFVFPRISLSTNFADTGHHMIRHEQFLQRPLLQSQKKFTWISLEDSRAVYDSYCEILPDRLSKLCPFLEKYSFETDLYGMKDPGKSEKDYFLTSIPGKDALMSFGRELKPLEANITEEIPGNVFSLIPRKNVRDIAYFFKLMRCSSKTELAYHMNERFYHRAWSRLLLFGGNFLYHPAVYPVLTKLLKQK